MCIYVKNVYLASVSKLDVTNLDSEENRSKSKY